ncbi:hypothetical protein LLG95_18685 [bacterium]|nr:hypothetical protein [bacterium]
MRRYGQIVALAVMLPLALIACSTAKKSEKTSMDLSKRIDAQVQAAQFTEDGNLIANIAEPIDKVLSAVQIAIDKRGFKIDKLDRGAERIDISAWPKEDVPAELKVQYKIALEPKGSQTQMIVHYGMFGHQMASRGLLDSTLRELETMK